MENFRNEQEHDWLLVGLVRDLDQTGRLDILSRHLLNGKTIGKLENAQRRRLFDVELTFENLSVIIETKVDSAESGGGKWNAEAWQTERIFTESQQHAYLKPDRVYLFVTYGTSEFYIKDERNGYQKGPGCTQFKHVKLEDMIRFIKDCLEQKVVTAGNKYSIKGWYDELEQELEKRKAVKEFAQLFAQFRSRYLSIHSDIDFPPHRTDISLPEIAFPLLAELGQIWNDDPKFNEPLGHVTSYPVSRAQRVHDSILNFTELWGKPSLAPLTCGGRSKIRTDGWNPIYFEINEDLHLHMKIMDGEGIEEGIRGYVEKCSMQLGSVAETPAKGSPCFYKQGSFVVFEWDFGMWDNVFDLTVVAINLKQVLSQACRILA
jgi:hypothetical protein